MFRTIVSGTRALALGVAILVSLVFPGVGQAAPSCSVHVHVGQSIQSAVDASSPGATICVDKGTFGEQVLINKDNITLIGAGAAATILTPPVQSEPRKCTTGDDPQQNGVCVGNLDAQGNILGPVNNVRISGLTVRDFPGIGVVLVGANGGQVDHVVAQTNHDYGITAFSSSNVSFLSNISYGAIESGIYVGVSPNAHFTISGNESYNNVGDGIVVRDSKYGVITHNNLHDNCSGLTFVNLGGGVGNWVASDNLSYHNDIFCPFNDLGLGVTASGNGIVILGAHDILLKHNTVTSNRWTTQRTNISGGVVVMSSVPWGGNDPLNNTIVGNTLSDNTPADLVYDGSGTGNRFLSNKCGTSMPKGLCR